jgi:hypothetical protein
MWAFDFWVLLNVGRWQPLQRLTRVT